MYECDDTGGGGQHPNDGEVSKTILEALAKAPTATAAGNRAPPDGDKGNISPKTDMKPKTLVLDFNPQEF